MKFKTTAIALAVAGIVAAPVAVQAGADEVYASARVGIKYTDTGGAADFDVKSFASRFGMRGETDLGNGITGFGRYEFGVNSAESSSNTITSRHLYVGLKGDFGSVLLGQTYHTFYNYVVGPLDNPWWHSTGTMVESVGRKPAGLTYSGGAGAVSFGATVYMVSDAEETPADVIELGASFAVGDSTIGVGYRSVDEDGAVGTQGNGTDEDVMAVAWSGIGIGDTTLGVSYMNQDKDNGIVVDWAIGNAYVHVETVDYDAGNTPLDITLGYTQSLGRKTTMYYEFNNKDADTDNSDDDYMAVMAVLKYDII
jgi:predicted porin